MKINIPTISCASSIKDTVSNFTSDKETALNCLRVIQASFSVLPRIKVTSDHISLNISFDAEILQQKNISHIGPLVFFENILRKILSELGGGYVVRRTENKTEIYSLTYKNLKISASCVNTKISPVIKVTL